MNKKLLPIAAFIAVLLGALYFFVPAPPDNAPDGTTAQAAELVPLDSGVSSGKALFQIYQDRPPVPDIAFRDEQGNSVTLADFRGQTLLVNFWATWCAPCREEMPELEALQQARNNDDFTVILLSVDRGGLAASRKFLDDIGVRHLALYYDEKGVLARRMKAIGYPSSVLVTRDGRQFGILTGPAHWNSESAHRLIDRLLRQ